MDQSEFIKQLEKHQGVIHKICRLYADHPEDRKDLFQDIVFQLYKGLPSFRGESAFSTWMYRIALTTTLSSLRKKRPDIDYGREHRDPVADEPDVPSDQQEQLFRALKKLAPAEKALVALYFEDLDHAEIAAITGISENYVAVKLNRIKTKIKNLIN